MKGIAFLICAFGLGVALAGCASEEPAHKESDASKAAAQESASKWTPEQIEAFGKAHERAKTGADEGPGGPEQSEGK